MSVKLVTFWLTQIGSFQLAAQNLLREKLSEGFDSRNETMEYCTTMCGAATCDSLSNITFEKFQDKNQCDRNSFHGYINLSEFRGSQVQSERLRESERSRTYWTVFLARVDGHR